MLRFRSPIANCQFAPRLSRSVPGHRGSAIGHWKSKIALPALALLFLSAAPLRAEVVTLPLTGTDATGGINLVGFDNEIEEPNAPASSEHVFDGNSSSHGFAYFQYQYDPDNAPHFNDYANQYSPDDSLWSIIVSSHTVADAAYYQSVLQKAGAVAYRNLTLDTQVLHPDPGAFDIGSLSYDTAFLTGVGTEVIAAGSIGLTITRTDYSFNVLNEDTTPGNWVGYPYYYWGIDNYTLTISDLTGLGLTFVDGILTSLDFQAAVHLTSPFASSASWDGTLTFSGATFAFDINDSDYVPGFGDLQVVMDRAGTFGLIPEPATGALLALGLAAMALRRRFATPRF